MDTPSDPKINQPHFAGSLRRKIRFHSEHPDLHRTFYALCVPSAIVALNAAIFFLVHGQVVWPTPDDTSAAWASDTYAGAWISLAANFAATVLFAFFFRHRRLHRSSRIAMSLVLTFAWFCAAISFLVID